MTRPLEEAFVGTILSTCGARFRPALFHDFTTTFAPGFSPQEVQVLWSFVTVLRCTCVSTAVQCVSSVYLVCFDCLFLSSPSLFRPVCHPQFGIGIRSCHPPIWTGPESDLPDQNARCSRAWHIPEESLCSGRHTNLEKCLLVMLSDCLLLTLSDC